MLVELADQVPDFESSFRRAVATEAIKGTAAEVSVCMAAECVAGQQDAIGHHYQGEEADAEGLLLVDKGAQCVVPQNQEHDCCSIKKVAMGVLQNPGETCFAAVATTLGANHAACRWCPKIGAVISLAVVITGCPKACRYPQDENGRRKLPPLENQFRRIKRRQK